MRLRQLIRESNAASILSTYFQKDKYESIEETPDGVNVDGNLIVKEDIKNLKHVPIKLNHVTGLFDVMNCGLTSLKNAPNSCASLSIGENPTLTSLATDTPIDISGELYADDLGITDLSGLNLKNCKSISLNRCKNLKSLAGLGNFNLKELNIKDCGSFEDDLTQYNIEKVNVTLDKSPNMPMVFLITSGTPKIISLGSDSNPLIKIAKKYIDKGPTSVLDLIRELRDQGFKNAARVS